MEKRQEYEQLCDRIEDYCRGDPTVIENYPFMKSPTSLEGKSDNDKKNRRSKTDSLTFVIQFFCQYNRLITDLVIELEDIVYVCMLYYHGVIAVSKQKIE